MGRHIQVETALRSHPKFRRICRLAGLSERDGLGALASLWLNVREVCPDGKMPGWTSDDLDDAAETPGISEHLLSVGFVDKSGVGLECHDWRDHSGRQCQDAERKSAERARKALEVPNLSLDSPGTVLGASVPRARARGREGKGMEGTGQDRNGQEESKAQDASRPPSTLPTLEEVRSYCSQRTLEGKPPVDPETWFDHYSSNGWKVGKNPMRDWRAAVRTWERNGMSPGRSKGVSGRQLQEFARTLKAQEESHEQG